MHIIRVSIFTSFLLSGLLFPSMLLADGVVKGRVFDDKNHPLPSALVRLRGLQGTKHTQTDQQGNYWFYGLTPGIYEIVFSAEGWTAQEMDCLLVRSNYAMTIDWTMRSGDIAESINIKYCGMKMIDKTSSNTGLYISRDMLEKFYR